MAEALVTGRELPNIVNIIAGYFGGRQAVEWVSSYETTIFSLIAIAIITSVAFFASRRIRMVPGRLQSALEMYVEGFDSFVCGIIGPEGRRFTPFIGTIFIYILSMNLLGLVPFMRSPTTNWSVTLALSILVFLYLQYTAIRQFGFIGFIDNLMGRPRGILAFTVVIPILMFFLHSMAELIRPVSLSLRLRSNMWGDDMVISILSGFGIKGAPLLLFNMFLTLLAAVVQACVFALLTTVYFALVFSHDETLSSNPKSGD